MTAARPRTESACSSRPQASGKRRLEHDRLAARGMHEGKAAGVEEHPLEARCRDAAVPRASA